MAGSGRKPGPVSFWTPKRPESQYQRKPDANTVRGIGGLLPMTAIGLGWGRRRNSPDRGFFAVELVYIEGGQWASLYQPTVFGATFDGGGAAQRGPLP